MFKFLTVVNVIAFIVYTIMWFANGFDGVLLSPAISHLFISILCGKLASMDDEITTLKTKLGIKSNTTSNNSSDDIMKFDPTNTDY